MPLLLLAKIYISLLSCPLKLELQRWQNKSIEHLMDFFSSKARCLFITLLKSAEGSPRAQQLSDEQSPSFDLKIWYFHLLQQLQQHISLTHCQHISWELPRLLKVHPKGCWAGLESSIHIPLWRSDLMKLLSHLKSNRYVTCNFLLLETKTELFLIVLCYK